MTAFSAAGRSLRAATISELMALHDFPIIPTLPSQAGWAAICAMTCVQKSSSSSVYSSVSTPSESPEPWRSTRKQRYSFAANHGYMRLSASIVPSRRR
jgi:hypothetical protein